MRSERDHRRTVSDRRKFRLAEELERTQSLVLGQVELGELGETRQVGYDQNGIAMILADECQNPRIGRTEKFGRTAPKGGKALA